MAKQFCGRGGFGVRGAFQESMEKVKGLKCYMSPGEKKNHVMCLGKEL